MLVIVLLFSIIIGTALFLFLAATFHKQKIEPTLRTFSKFLASTPLKGEKYEVLLVLDNQGSVCTTQRENYTLVANEEGFGLAVSFPASLYSKQKPLFFPWNSVEKLDRSLMTNLFVCVEGREEPFLIQAGFAGSKKVFESWSRNKPRKGLVSGQTQIGKGRS